MIHYPFRMLSPPPDATGIGAEATIPPDNILPEQLMALFTTLNRRLRFFDALEEHFDRTEADPGFIRYRLIGQACGAQFGYTLFFLIGHVDVHLRILGGMNRLPVSYREKQPVLTKNDRKNAASVMICSP
ncbi:MAG: hypothetical protein IKP40_11485 [Clostridia bacterium]|nr:hypothetical protein [Clostridia bacterium]